MAYPFFSLSKSHRIAPIDFAAGDVAGIVFARGEDGAGRGYAITMAELEPALAAIAAGSATVASGSCTA